MARTKGEGSIYKWEEKGLWVAEITVDGRRTKKYGKTQKEARGWLLEMRKQVQAGGLVDDKRMTFGQFLERWFEDVAKPKIRESTAQSHSSIIRNHLLPELGEIRLSNLSPMKIQTLCTKKLKSGLSTRTVRYIYTLTHQALAKAVEWGYVAKNAADGVSTPRPTSKAITPLTKEQVWHFLEILKDDRLYPLYVLYLGCGLRRGEALALLVTDVDFATSTIRVGKTIQMIIGKGLVVGEAKSEASARVVAMPSFVESALRNHLQTRGIDSPYLFATSNGTPFIPRNVVRHFKSTLKKAGLPTQTRIHDLRHFFVSWLLSKGTPPKDVQVIVGHADFATTMGVYGHMMAGADREAAKRMDDLFTGQ